ncbi:DNA excision repair protein ERCC-5 [Microcaecilia unicolor]|uniref:DNA repair protein complementing XP-G cells n=1 Tax=Microcaecilia unicolor TaxID=1415580 RepID=A0A6P7XPA7_9AMPH|nr:DNA repair protein complementing XP-G cells [Microcaecilia unicolor]XP_030057192.1 DNA repair protein complementing XP-G cells [Microcaecilia unicolor]
MGVQGLWKLLECTGRPIDPETLEGKILAIDISIWLNQAVKGARDRQGNAMQNAHLLVLFHRLCKLLFFRIRPVFVFDGGAPLLKKQTLAKRRQRREVAASDSKKTTEKLMKTLLKRQAIKMALTDKSGELDLGLSQVQRKEIDAIYVLPSLEEKEKTNSEEEDEREWEEKMTQKQLLQEEFFENPHSVDIESEDFSCLPPEMKHEILTDMKEFTKRRRTLFEPMPEESNDFSQYQLKGLLKKNSLNMHIQNVQREMNEQYSEEVQTQYKHKGCFLKDVETRRLVSEEASHYILIKGVKTKKADAEEMSSVSPPSRLLGDSKCTENLSKSNVDGNLPSVERDSKVDTAPPSPRTVFAIQEALLGNSSEEDAEEMPSISPPSRLLGDSKCTENLSKTNVDGKLPSIERGSKVDSAPPSPRTVLAIQEALLGNSSEEEAEGKKMTHSVNVDSPYPLSDEVHGHVSPQILQDIQQPLNENNENDSCNIKTVVISEGAEADSSRKAMLLVNSSDEDEETQEIKCGQEPQPCLLSSDRHFTQIVEECSKDAALEKIIVPSEEYRTQGTNSPAIGRGDVDSTQCYHSGNDGSSLSDNIISEALTDASNVSKPVASLTYTPPLGSTCIETNMYTRNGESKCVPKANQQTRREPLKPYHLFPEGPEVSKIAVKDESSSDSDGSFIEVEADSTDLPRFLPDTVKTLQPTYEREITTASTKTVPALDMDRARINADNSINNTLEDVALTEQKAEIEKDKEPIINEWQDINMEELESVETALFVQQTTLQAERQQQDRIATSVTGQMCLESQELLRLFGIPYIVSPMEAEAQCAILDLTDQTSGTITDDSDIWLFGARHVYRNFFSQNKYIEYYQSVDIKNHLGLDRYKLINLAYLLGSDYTDGIPTVGYVTAMEILNEFTGPGMEPLIKFTEWWTEAQKTKKMKPNPHYTKVKKKLYKLELSPGFPSTAVAEAYLKPVVDDSHGTFSWGRPDLEQIREFCESRFGWYQSKTDEVLLPVLRQLNAYQSQLRIDSLFRLEQHEKQAIKSQRLRRAVTCMLRKEREEEAEEKQDATSVLEKEARLSRKRKDKRPLQLSLNKPQGDNRHIEKRKRFSNIRHGNASCESGAYLSVPQLSEGFSVRNFQRKAMDMSTSASTSQEHQITVTGEKDSAGLKTWQGSSMISSSTEEEEEEEKTVLVTARSVFGHKKGKPKCMRGRKKQ